MVEIKQEEIDALRASDDRPEWKDFSDATAVEMVEALLLRLERAEAAKEELRKIAYEQASRILLVERERDAARAEGMHWKSNHDNQVAKLRLYTQREDLPVDRLPAYREMQRLQARIAELEASKADLAKKIQIRDEEYMRVLRNFAKQEAQLKEPGNAK